MSEDQIDKAENPLIKTRMVVQRERGEVVITIEHPFGSRTSQFYPNQQRWFHHEAQINKGLYTSEDPQKALETFFQENQARLAKEATKSFSDYLRQDILLAKHSLSRAEKELATLESFIG